MSPAANILLSQARNVCRHGLLLGIKKMSVLVADGEGPVFHLGAAKADRQKSTHSRRSASVGTVGKHLFFDSVLNRCRRLRQKRGNHSWESVSEWFGVRKPCL
jgi:hypothetical protein